MTALARETIRRHSTPIGQSHAHRYIGLVGDTGIVYPGSIMMQIAGSDYAQKVIADADAVCLGWADIPFPIDTAGLVDGDRKICIRDGIVGPLDNSAAADEVTDAHRNRIVFLVDDNTVSATDQTGTLSCPVRLDRIDSEGAYILIGREQV
jgi:hypothetical protein